MSRTRGALGRHARRHGHYSGPSGHHKRKSERSRVVAWDGEGFEHTDGSQRYGLLMNSEGTDLANTDGLHTLDMLQFLTDTARRIGRSVYHVGFGISYDVNMILADVPRKKLERIADSSIREPTYLGGRRFAVRYVPAKSFWVKDLRTSTSVMLYDTFGFHQTSFVRAAEKMLGAADERLNVVREGKKVRGAFRPSDVEMVRRYTRMELELTVEMTERILSATRAVGLFLARLDGAGAVAAAMLKKYGVRRFMGLTPDSVHVAATYAYAGGRAELIQVGHSTKGGYGTDMRSAYPTMLCLLPCLAHGRWRHVPDGDFKGPFAVAEIRWNYRQMGYRDGWLMPFALRSSSGAIYYPEVGHTWVWKPELDAAMRVRRFASDDRLSVLDGWEWEPACDHHPFNWVPTVYRERLERKKLGDATEMPLKLGLNSGYGKLAQHVGGSPDKPPPFHQLEWAGYVTSGTRARIFTVAERLGGDKVISLMTDGILTTRDPTDALDTRVGEQLSEWELKKWTHVVSAQSGVYFYTDGQYVGACPKCGSDTERTSLGGWRCLNPLCRRSNYTAHFRGFNPDSIDPDEILMAWDRLEDTLVTSVRRFHTLRESLKSDRAWKRWRTWTDEPRVLVIHATGKRQDIVSVGDWTRRENPQYGLMATTPSEPFNEDSFPYVLPWDDEQVDGAEGIVGGKEQVSLE